MTDEAYRDAAPWYWELGWRSVLPIPPRRKKPPPDGYTGADAPDPSYADICEWAEQRPNHNIALRVPANVIGVDVDDYDGKSGAGVIEHAAKLWGDLPATWTSTSRAGTKSGIRFYRLPEPVALASEIKFPDLGLAGVEIVQRHHRYAVVFPSLHPDGRVYEWFDPEGQRCAPPSPDELPRLPDAWIAALAATSPERADTAAVEPLRLIRSYADGPMSPRVKRKLDEASRALREAGGASRHDTALKAVMALERYGAEGEPGVRDALVMLENEFVRAVAGDGSRDEREARREYRRMWTNKRGHALIAISNDQPKERALRVVNGADAPTPQAVTEPEPEPGARRPEGTDDDNGARFVEAHAHRARFCPERSRWAVYDGTRWRFQPDKGGQARELMKQVARNLPDSSDKQVRHKHYSLSARGVTNALESASTVPEITTAPEEFDAHPLELNTPGGACDLVTSTLLGHDPAKLHTLSTAATPDPGADKSLWLAFLAKTFGDDQELIAYMKRLAGYWATGLVRDQILPFLFGGGANGKSVLVGTIVGVLGDYATMAPSDFLMARTHQEHKTELARLLGKRLVVCSEIDPDARFNEQRVKDLTGGEHITARFVNKDFFTFPPTHKLILMGNHKPAVRAGGHSMWRRVKLVPFEHTVPEHERIEDLQGVFVRDHAPAILAWIVEGAAEYLEHGLKPPSKVLDATNEYASEEDTIAQWLDENARIGGDPSLVKVKMSIAYSDYTEWCRGAGLDPVSKRNFGITLKRDHGVQPIKSNGVRLYGGLSILPKEEEAREW